MGLMGALERERACYLAEGEAGVEELKGWERRKGLAVAVAAAAVVVAEEAGAGLEGVARAGMWERMCCDAEVVTRGRVCSPVEELTQGRVFAPSELLVAM